MLSYVELVFCSTMKRAGSNFGIDTLGESMEMIEYGSVIEQYTTSNSVESVCESNMWYPDWVTPFNLKKNNYNINPEMRYLLKIETPLPSRIF